MAKFCPSFQPSSPSLRRNASRDPDVVAGRAPRSNHPIRRTLPLCCASAASAVAKEANEATPTNVRRFILKLTHCPTARRIAILAASRLPTKADDQNGPRDATPLVCKDQADLNSAGKAAVHQ